MNGILRNKITFVDDSKVLWEVTGMMKAGALDLPEKDGFITLPKEEVGEKNRFWVKRVDIDYVKHDNARSGVATEVRVLLSRI